MMDFLPDNLITNITPNDYISWYLKKYYNINDLNSRCFYGLNLGDTDFEFSMSFDRYVVSFHTEYLNVDRIIEQAILVHPKPVLLITDYDIDIHPVWPDNITFARNVTIYHQIRLASELYGINSNPLIPDYKLSSLSMRVSQYKAFVTAYLIEQFNHNELILSYHNWLLDDALDHIDNIPPLDHLKNLNLNIGKKFINLQDESKIVNRSPISNTNWHVPAYTNALVNVTNESYHYTDSVKKDQHFTYPTAYITEKTFKPLLAGRPFIPVGQAGTIKFLNELGFTNDFGFDLSFDNDTGDLTRIKGVFDVLDYVVSTPIQDLYESSLKSVIHNSNHVINGGLEFACEKLNKTGFDTIHSWHT